MPNTNHSRFYSRLLLWALGLLLTGCATYNPDPLEPYNRAMRHFNQTADKVIIRPIAQAYDFITPKPIRQGIRNALSNLHEPSSAINHILQGHIFYAMSDIWRFMINSTFGLAGIIDVASHLNLPKNQQDFGLTLGKWGYQQSAYLVLPLLGPSTLRDVTGLIVDNSTFSAYRYVEPTRLRNTTNSMRVIDSRANLLDIDDVLTDSLDPYIAERNAYLQHRLTGLGQASTLERHIESEIDDALAEDN